MTSFEVIPPSTLRILKTLEPRVERTDGNSRAVQGVQGLIEPERELTDEERDVDELASEGAGECLGTWP